MDAVRMAGLPATGTEVLVVGAGPAGLMAGLVLARRGVPVVVADQEAGPARESRALAVQARTMEIYDQLGLAGQVLSGAYPALRMQIGAVSSGGSVSRMCSRARPGSRACRSSSRAPMSGSCPARWLRRAPTCCGGTGWST